MHICVRVRGYVGTWVRGSVCRCGRWFRRDLNGAENESTRCERVVEIRQKRLKLGNSGPVLPDRRGQVVNVIRP